MGPIGAKVIEAKGQIYVVFFLFVPPRSLGRSSPNLVGRWSAAPDNSSRGSFFKGQCHRGQSRSSPNLEGRWRAAPDISLRGSFFERSRSSRSKVKFMLLFFLFVPLLLPGPWADLHQTWWEGGVRPRILARGVHFLKVKVIEVKGQISVSRQSFV